MNCPKCNGQTNKAGKDRKGLQRYMCASCNLRFTEPKPLEKMRLPMEKALLILQCLVEGNSVRSTMRIANVEKRTVLHLLEFAGRKCEKLMNDKIKNVPVEAIESDEIWAYILKKEGHKRPEEIDDYFIGDAWTFVAIERTSKLIVCFALGRRDTETAIEFARKLRKATGETRFQLSTDGFAIYRGVVEQVFGTEIDFAQLIKNFESNGDENDSAEHRYSPGQFVTSTKTIVTGNPDWDKISTSYVERQNLTMRMSMRRFTRLTNGFSKKWENLYWMLCLYFAYINFCRIHQTLRVTPAMEAKITDHIWSLEELVAWKEDVKA